MEAVCLFADISGFTALAESLSLEGREGAELLASALSELFEPMVGSVLAQGGSIVGFAGDSFTALFPLPSVGPAPAAAAAWAIRQVVADRPTRQIGRLRYTFGVKIGLASGSASWQVLGDRDGQRFVSVAGPAVDGAAAAEVLANPGQIVAHRSLDLLAGGPSVGDSHLLLQELPPAGSGDIVAASNAPDVLAAFFPPTLLDPELRGDFRWVVTVFIGVKDPSAVAAFVERSLEVSARLGGFLSKVDSGDKGTTLLLFWGAPRKLERDVERGLAFLAELRRTFGDAFRAGVSHELMFAGFAGAAQREEYTCYGRGVNLAARLMMHAGWGESWVDGPTASAGAASFDLKRGGQLQLKGFRAAQPAWMLVGRRTDSGPLFAGELAGRAEEMAELQRFLAPLNVGQPAGSFCVYGQPGVGKSRLVEELRRVRRPGIRWVSSGCDAISPRSLAPIRQLVRRILVLPIQDDRISQRGDLAASLASLALSLRMAGPENDPLVAELERIRPMLAGLLGLEETGSVYDGLSSALRMQNIQQAVLSVLTALAQSGPVVLHVDDIQWLDADSKTLLDHVASRAGQLPVALLFTSRLGDDGARPLAGTAERGGGLLLGGLSRNGVAAVAEHRLRAPISPALLTYLCEQSDGVPFFVEQLALELSEGGRLAERDGQLVRVDPRALELSVGLDGVLTSRLDRLARGVQRAVRGAAVLGLVFQAGVLEAAVGGDVGADLDAAVSASILAAEGPGQFRFTHGLMRDAAYQIQLHAERRDRHRASAEALLVVHAEHLGPHHDAIGGHFAAAGEHEAARRHLGAAVEQARAAHDSVATLRLCAALRELCPAGGDDVTEATFWKALKAELTVLQLGGRLREAVELGRRELQGPRDPSSVFRNARAAGDRFGREDQLISILNWAHLDARAGGDAQAAEVLMREVGALAEQSGEPWIAGRAFAFLSTLSILSVVGREELAQRALAIFREAGDRLYQGAMLHNLATIAVKRGEVVEARAGLVRGQGLFAEQGSKHFEGNALNALANLEAACGDLSASHELFARARAAFEEVGLAGAAGLAFANEAIAWSWQGRPDVARVCLDRAVELFGEGVQGARRAFLAVARGEVEESAGDLDLACAHYAVGESMGRAISHPYIWLTAQRRRGRALASLGRLDEAKAELQGAREACGDHVRLKAELETELAGLALAAAQLDEAEALLASAGPVLLRSEVGFELCRWLAADGGLALARGDRSLAESRVGEAVAMLDGFDVEGGPVVRDVGRLRDGLAGRDSVG
jgi:class 3 adenylate cyclase/tetratricopeptide (TPR) repeat protein